MADEKINNGEQPPKNADTPQGKKETFDNSKPIPSKEAVATKPSPEQSEIKKSK
jgi:hypothetical protein